MKDMLQKIAAICTIISFLSGIYTSFADNPEWQRYSLFVVAFLCLIVAFVSRKYKFDKSGGVITLKGTQHFSYDDMKVSEIQVFYPKLFKNPPNLTVKFKKSETLHPWSQTGKGTARDSVPEYSVTEPHPGGFKLKVFFLPASYDSVFEWHAKGEIKD